MIRGAVVTIGSFDGLHAGHRALLAKLMEEASKTGRPSVVVTFDPHPRVALGTADGMRELTPLAIKKQRFKELGISELVVLPFDTALARMTAAEFLDTVLPGIHTLVMGYNHRFGSDGADIEALCHARGVRVVRVPALLAGDKPVSSTRIRNLLDAGLEKEASKLL